MPLDESKLRTVQAEMEKEKEHAEETRSSFNKPAVSLQDRAEMKRADQTLLG